MTAASGRYTVPLGVAACDLVPALRLRLNSRNAEFRGKWAGSQARPRPGGPLLTAGHGGPTSDGAHHNLFKMVEA